MKIFKAIAGFIVVTALNSTAFAEWVDVTAWNSNPSLNAKGDGVTDDSPAVQAAINSMTTGGTLYFPAGIYRLDATVNSGSEIWNHYALLITNENLTITGDGPGSVLLQRDFQNTLIYAGFTTTVGGLTVEDLKFQADLTNTYTAPGDAYASGKLFACAGVGKSAGWTKGLRVKNVYTEDNGKRNAIQVFGMDDVLIEGCHFVSYATTNMSQGPGFPSVWTSSEGLGSFRMVNNYFDGGCTVTNPTFGADGMVWEQTGEETVISGNTIVNFKLEGIQCGARQQTITGNDFRALSTGAVGVSVTPNSGWTTVGLSNIQVSIANNTQMGGSTFVVDVDIGSDTGIKIDYVIQNNTVTLGNKWAGLPGGFALWLYRMQRSIISGNTFDNYNDRGFVLAGTGDPESSLAIQGNILTSMATNSLNGTGITINDQGATPFIQNLTILNNQISSAHNGAVNVVAANTPTNYPGRFVFGNNIYVGSDNMTSNKWIRVNNINVTTASTNLGGYSVTDLNPGPF